MSPTHSAEPKIARDVLSYFLRNPRATDSLEGIARWRLLEEQVNRSLKETEAAISWLARQGFLEELTPPGSAAPVFRLNRDRRAEAVQYLADKGKWRGKSGAKKRG